MILAQAGSDPSSRTRKESSHTGRHSCRWRQPTGDEGARRGSPPRHQLWNIDSRSNKQVRSPFFAKQALAEEGRIDALDDHGVLVRKLSPTAICQTGNRSTARSRTSAPAYEAPLSPSARIWAVHHFGRFYRWSYWRTQPHHRERRSHPHSKWRATTRSLCGVAAISVPSARSEKATR